MPLTSLIPVVRLTGELAEVHVGDERAVAAQWTHRVKGTVQPVERLTKRYHAVVRASASVANAGDELPVLRRQRCTDGQFSAGQSSMVDRRIEPVLMRVGSENSAFGIGLCKLSKLLLDHATLIRRATQFPHVGSSSPELRGRVRSTRLCPPSATAPILDSTTPPSGAVHHLFRKLGTSGTLVGADSSNANYPKQSIASFPRPVAGGRLRVT